MGIEDAAKAGLSGEYSRRRGYLSGFISSWNGFALSGTLAIWGFLLDWSALADSRAGAELFATQVAWASALSSILLGFWRLYARFLDDRIVSLYAVIYVCERALLPEGLETQSPPEGAAPLSQQQAAGPFEWRSFPNSAFGGRAHGVFDSIAAAFVGLFGVTSVATGLAWAVIGISGTPHRVGLLLIGNAIGLGLILWGWRWWQAQTKRWPMAYRARNTWSRTPVSPDGVPVDLAQ